jgi:signal transduction histidine kinase
METIESVRSSVQTLEQRLEQLEEESRLRNQFLGKLSHELGNLFLPYQFALQLLRNSSADLSTVHQVRKMLEEHGENVNRFMADLRLISRLVRRKVRFQPQPVDWKQVVERSLATIKPLMDKSQLVLAADLPVQPLVLEGDRCLLQQMVDHLLSNAVKFTQAGGRVGVALKRENDQCVLQVCDSGVGIAPEYMPHLFIPFAQADPSSPGWGAGLAIVREVAELHGGRVEALSPGVGQGSEFVVRLPGA